ncbi:Uncharacterized protein DAT39_011311, partial [Clarias magur]
SRRWFLCWDMKWKRLQGCKCGQISSSVKHFSVPRPPLADQAQGRERLDFLL